MRPFAEAVENSVDGTVEDHPTRNSILLHAGYFPSHLFKRTINFPVFKGTSP